MTMASKKNSAKKAPVPKGFVEARQRLDGFFERSEGNAVQGILRGHFEVKGKFGVRRVFRIEITDGETQVGEGDVLGPGATIGLDETGYTKVLGELTSGTVVFARYEGKGPDARDPHVFTVAKLAD
jgi:hypothetical protein